MGMRKLLMISAILSCAAFAQTGNLTINNGSIDFSAAGHTLPAKKGTTASKPAACTIGELYFATDATPGQNMYLCTAANTWTQLSGIVSSNGLIRSFGAAFDGGGSAITAGKTVYLTIPFACTIAGYNIVADTGTISFDVWKVATGTAIPTAANTILTGGYLALTTGTALHSTSTANFSTTAVAANDIVAVKVQSVASATFSALQVQCNAN
jgi:hypothetical protein